MADDDFERLRDDLARAPILQLLSVAGMAVTRRWQQFASQQHGMTTAGVSALMMISRGTDRVGGEHGTPGRASHAELARRMWVTPATLTGIVDTLAKAGYVQRVRDETDRRVVWLTLTPAGADRARELAEQAAREFGSGIAVEDPAHEKIIRDFLVEFVTSQFATPQGAHACPRPARMPPSK